MRKYQLAPSKKARKYCDQLHVGGFVNKDAVFVREFSDKEKAYRLGYVKARSDLFKARKAWNAKHLQIIVVK